jgi:hypothetical protein
MEGRRQGLWLMIEPIKRVIRLYREVLKEGRMQEIWRILKWLWCMSNFVMPEG